MWLTEVTRSSRSTFLVICFVSKKKVTRIKEHSHPLIVYKILFTTTHNTLFLSSLSLHSSHTTTNPIPVPSGTSVETCLYDSFLRPTILNLSPRGGVYTPVSRLVSGTKGSVFVVTAVVPNLFRSSNLDSSPHRHPDPIRYDSEPKERVTPSVAFTTGLLRNFWKQRFSERDRRHNTSLISLW